MLSYHADMTLENNPFELGMDRLVDLDMDADFVSKTALTRIHQQGVSQLQVGLEFDGPPITGSNDEHWPILIDGYQVGHVTSAVYSPRLEKNIALAMVAAAHAGIGTEAVIDASGETRGCKGGAKAVLRSQESLGREKLTKRFGVISGPVSDQFVSSVVVPAPEVG